MKLNGYQIICESLSHKIQVLPDDKGRHKGTKYYKGGEFMYNVVVDMGRLPKIGPQGDLIDVWVGDSVQDFINQLDEIQMRGGGEHFRGVKEIKNHPTYGDCWVVPHSQGDHKWCFLRDNVEWIKETPSMMRIVQTSKPIVFYHYVLPTKDHTSKEILQMILEDGKLRPGSEIKNTEKDYANRPADRRREEGIVYLTPHKLNIPNTYRFIIPEHLLKDYIIQIKGKKYPKQYLIQKAIDSIKEDPQDLFERYNTRRLRGLVQIVYHGSIPIHGLKYELAQ